MHKLDSTPQAQQTHEDGDPVRRLPPARVRVRRAPSSPAPEAAISPKPPSSLVGSSTVEEPQSRPEPPPTLPAADQPPADATISEPTRKKPKGDYQVGYGKPPKHTQFKPGNRANPKGRPRGTKSIPKITERLLGERVKYRHEGKLRRATYREVYILGLRQDALKGDRKALELLLKLDPAMKETANDEEVASASAELSPQDQALVLSYLRRRGPKPEPEE